MENARQLDERLRRIIREVSSRTGSEIKGQLVEEFTRSVEQIAAENHRRQAAYFMSILKKSLDELE